MKDSKQGFIWLLILSKIACPLCSRIRVGNKYSLYQTISSDSAYLFKNKKIFVKCLYHKKRFNFMIHRELAKIKYKPYKKLKKKCQSINKRTNLKGINSLKLMSLITFIILSKYSPSTLGINMHSIIFSTSTFRFFIDRDRKIDQML
jgi:hypothetical protein